MNGGLICSRPRVSPGQPGRWRAVCPATAGCCLASYLALLRSAHLAYLAPLRRASVVAVLLGILLLHERPAPSEFVGMAGIVAAVFLLTTAQVKGKPPAIEELEQMPAE